jgi:allantoin racemase
MRILVLNPNTSAAVTARIRGVVDRLKHPDSDVTVAQIAHGPRVLESSYDEALAIPHVLEAVTNANAQGFDAIIIAAFCDPGLDAAREISSIPVYGLEETTCAAALLLGNRFGILTEHAHKVAVKQQHIRRHGLEQRFASVRPIGMGVEAIAAEPERVKRVGIEVARRMVEEDGAEVIVLGCASMAGHGAALEQALNVPVLDPIAVTLKIAEGLTAIGVRHSKRGLYATPVAQQVT